MSCARDVHTQCQVSGNCQIVDCRQVKQSRSSQPHSFQIANSHSKVGLTDISFYYVKVCFRCVGCADNPGDLLLGARYQCRLNKQKKLATSFCQAQQQAVGNKTGETRNKICLVTCHVSGESNPRSARV